MKTWSSCGSEAIVLERNQLVEKLNEIEVRYEQVRNQLDEVKLERDNLQRSHTATSQKFQNAIDDMSAQILNLTNEKIQFETTIEQLKTNGSTLNPNQTLPENPSHFFRNNYIGKGRHRIR